MKTGDIGNIIEFTVRNRDDVLVDLGTVTKAELVWRTPDGVEVVKTLTNMGASKVRYAIKDHDLDDSGNYDYEIVLTYADGSILHSTNIMREYVKNSLSA